MAKEVKDVALVKTNFSVQDHGFQFVNSFNFTAEYRLPFFDRPIKLGHISCGLCGGMCFAALDYFHTTGAAPTYTRVADIDPDLEKYLQKRQMDSLSLPLGVLKVIEWMLRSDREVRCLTVGREFSTLRDRLARGKPAVLVLIRVGGFEDPTQNHQVVAHSYELDEAAKQLKIYIYDPNQPGQESWLAMNFENPGQGIDAQQSSGEYFRGFFVADYSLRTPPQTTPPHVVTDAVVPD